MPVPFQGCYTDSTCLPKLCLPNPSPLCGGFNAQALLVSLKLAGETPGREERRTSQRIRFPEPEDAGSTIY